jgi:hypothetical protein
MRLIHEPFAHTPYHYGVELLPNTKPDSMAICNWITESGLDVRFRDAGIYQYWFVTPDDRLAFVLAWS